MKNKMKETIIKKILNNYRDLPLKRKLLLLFYIQIIIPIAFIGYIFYGQTSVVIKNKSFDYSQDILKMIDMRVENFAEDVDSLSLQLLYDNKIYSFLSNNCKGVVDPVEQYTNSSHIRYIFRDAVLSREGIEGICLVTSKQDYVYFDSRKVNFDPRDSLPYDYLYARALGAKGGMKWITYTRRDNPEQLYGARVIYSRDDFKPIGLMVILFKNAYIESIYKDLSSEAHNSITILSEDNEVIADSKDSNRNITATLDKIGKQKENYFTDKDTNSLVSYVLVEKPKWKIVYSISLKTLYKDIDELRISTILMVLLCIIILSIISRFTAIDITKPINKLVKAMRNLENNGTHIEIEVERNDEIGYLTKTFNDMSYNIDYLLNVNYKEKLTRKEAQLKALQAQINPHFIFNTLENINWVAQLNGVEEISTTVTALANIMEASIGRGHKLIQFKEELTYIDSYIDIFKARFVDKVTIEENIDEETLEVSIPRLLIEPIVENALNHGIERVIRKGKLIITAYIQEQDLVVEVYDNGIGMTKDELQELNNKIHSTEESEKYGDSIGLTNVNERIKLFYGESYGLEIESEYNVFTKVKVRIAKENHSMEV